ncbi:MAG: aminotransferase class V-fold PLP-dependent enzyme [Clostridia bacterium]|nr:aminotransferase class V-fold PLP-dependent enzyme [Clostridia bacterium]
MEKREMIYLDNAATSFPKPYAVSDAVKKYMLYCGGNAGRGGYESAIQAGRLVYECREKLSEFFGAKSAEAVFFTMNTTQSINACIRGSLKKGDRVLISNIEHNAVYRPIYKLSSKGQIDYDTFSVIENGVAVSQEEIIADIEKKVTKNTTMIVCTAASNICSVRTPIREIGELCRSRGIRFVVDAAQAAGHFPLSVEDMKIDALCVPAHKGLLGPQGCGAVLLGEGVKMQTVCEGGNGVDSLSGEMSEDPPERYEAGTLPLPAIAGFGEGIEVVKEIGLERIEAHEAALFKRAREELLNIGGVKIFCPESEGSVILFEIEGKGSEEVAAELAKAGICVRGGYHCAALAHKAMGTEESGAVRASFGIFNKESDVDALCDAVRKISK